MEHPLPRGIVDIADCLVLVHDARVVHEHVDAAVSVDGGLHDHLGVSALGDVALEPDDGAACGGHLFDDLAQAGLVPLTGDDLGAFGGEQVGHRAAHPRTRARDDHYLVLESHCGPPMHGVELRVHGPERALPDAR